MTVHSNDKDGIFLKDHSRRNDIIYNHAVPNDEYFIAYAGDDCTGNYFNLNVGTIVNIDYVPPGPDPDPVPTPDPNNVDPLMLGGILVSSLFLGYLVLFLVGSIGFIDLMKRKKMRSIGLDPNRVYRQPGIIVHDNNRLNRESYIPKYLIPKEIEPYEFFCSVCQKISLGYEIFCSTCGTRMKRYDASKINQIMVPISKNFIAKSEIKCILCHSYICPTCSSEIKGDVSCYEECPYCEKSYHKHCWDITMAKFGKCGFCLESPPPELL